MNVGKIHTSSILGTSYPGISFIFLSAFISGLIFFVFHLQLEGHPRSTAAFLIYSSKIQCAQYSWNYQVNGNISKDFGIQVQGSSMWSPAPADFLGVMMKGRWGLLPD